MKGTMLRTMLKSKIHRAQVTGSELEYEGSIAIDFALCDAARLIQYEKVEIYNCNNGNRFSTYVIYGQPGEICLKGAAARLVQKGDVIIIASYAEIDEDDCITHRPHLVYVDKENAIIGVKRDISL